MSTRCCHRRVIVSPSSGAQPSTIRRRIRSNTYELSVVDVASGTVTTLARASGDPSARAHQVLTRG